MNFRLSLSVLLLAVGSAFAAPEASGQGRALPYSPECIQYLSNYETAYKAKDYDKALVQWRGALRHCPQNASQNLYIRGVTLLSKELGKHKKGSARAMELVDSLLMLQDRRVQHYPSSAPMALNSKGQYLISYKGDDLAVLRKELEKIITAIGPSSRPSLLVNDLDAAVKLYSGGKIGADEVLSTYGLVTGALDGVSPKDSSEAAVLAKTRSDLASIFALSKVAGCSEIVAVMTPKFNASPDDPAVATSVVRLMNTVEGCQSDELYMRAVVTLHKSDPSSKTAYNLYRMYLSRKNRKEALRYLDEAAERAETSEEKAAILYELAAENLRDGNRGKVKEIADRLVTMDCGYTGKAYLLVGNLWMSAPCGGNEISSRARFWAAADYFQMAANADPSIAGEARSLTGRCSAYWPEAADAFMYGISAGQGYTVSCGGMSKSTVVRVK